LPGPATAPASTRLEPAAASACGTTQAPGRRGSIAER
jgi:hypothetical protein